MNSLGDVCARLYAAHDRLVEAARYTEESVEPFEEAHAMLAMLNTNSDLLDQPVALLRKTHAAIREASGLLPAVSASIGSITTRLCGSVSEPIAMEVPEALPEQDDGEELNVGPFHLLKRSDAAAVLGVRDASLKYAEPNMMRMKIFEKTYRFPSPYVEALAGTGLIAQSGIKDGSQAFSLRPLAQSAITASIHGFERAIRHTLSEDGPVQTLSAAQVAGLFAVSRMTVTNWVQSGELRTFSRDPGNHNSPIVVPIEAVRNAYIWMRPHTI